MSVEIRGMREDEGEAFLLLRKQIVGETPFLLREPDEILVTVEEIQELQEEIRAETVRGELLMLVAEQDKRLVGYLTGARGKFKRNRHALYLTVGIVLAFTGQGIGTRFFVEMENWARQQGITRLDLTVTTHNEAGIALYKKCGFEIEGTKRHSLLIDGKYVDEYMMAKLLS
jgi:RimJ/RimL family protein N-acetyltransferase